jgi:hypothetical protein
MDAGIPRKYIFKYKVESPMTSFGEPISSRSALENINPINASIRPLSILKRIAV